MVVVPFGVLMTVFLLLARLTASSELLRTAGSTRSLIASARLFVGIKEPNVGAPLTRGTLGAEAAYEEPAMRAVRRPARASPAMQAGEVVDWTNASHALRDVDQG